MKKSIALFYLFSRSPSATPERRNGSPSEGDDSYENEVLDLLQRDWHLSVIGRPNETKRRISSHPRLLQAHRSPRIFSRTESDFKEFTEVRHHTLRVHPHTRKLNHCWEAEDITSVLTRRSFRSEKCLQKKLKRIYLGSIYNLRLSCLRAMRLSIHLPTRPVNTCQIVYFHVKKTTTARRQAWPTCESIDP